MLLLNDKSKKLFGGSRFKMYLNSNQQQSALKIAYKKSMEKD